MDSKLVPADEFRHSDSSAYGSEPVTVEPLQTESSKNLKAPVRVASVFVHFLPGKKIPPMPIGAFGNRSQQGNPPISPIGFATLKSVEIR